jgi:AcrR family transcriptional regulator
MFGERGYEETTMRAIAEKAGVAIGNTYYHFRSKEHLIQAYYERIHEIHSESCSELLSRERTLKGRLLGVMGQILENMAPYHQFAGILFKTAADPQSPLNPLSPESEPTRRASIELFAEVVKGAKSKIPSDLEAELTADASLALSHGHSSVLDSRRFERAEKDAPVDRTHG